MESRVRKRRTSEPWKRVLLFISALMVVFGLWFSTTNAYTFLKGYLLFKYSEPVYSVEGEGNTGTVAQPKRESAVSETEDVEEQIKENQKDGKSGPLYMEKPEVGEEIGVLHIPKLNADLPIYHGTDEDELEKGVGHYAGSVLPGEKDNSVLSGHRDTVFRELGQVGEDDLMMVTTSAGKFTYKVKRVRIVDEDDRTVIVPRPSATLTVSTCYPFNFIGSAPERYVLEAVLIKTE
ncbi:class D sortase [Evansella clarkii]|uniref:class D sortase n=1 Tax=Evansella clarkii TaxID=79879 RepID=UPI0039C045AE